ncbi:CHAT domain-containing protein [Longimicrobium sp.]|uniref:CHAT domain-containing protein n=1 Tax=Longimicrobium sp. TaxID=2029185 RepID=UPI003B3AD054
MIRRLVPLSLLLLVALATWAVYARSHQPAGVLHELVRARPGRAFPARLSVPTAYRTCTRVELPADSTMPRERCGDDADMPLELEHLAAARESFDPDSLHASALAAVLWWDEKPASLDETILHLENVLRLREDSVPLLVDLSAVYQFRAQEKQTPRDLVMSLNYARQALMIEPRNQSALWNAALTSEALYLDTSADSAWSAYLAVDGDSPWADEASARQSALRKLRERPTLLDRPTVSSPMATVHAYADAHPQEAREQGWNDVLGAWGNAVLSDSTSSADSLLNLASHLGTALANRPRGDASLADAVQAIRSAASDPAATTTLARAHADYARAQAIFSSNRDTAWALYAQVRKLRPSSPALVALARAFAQAVDDRYLEVLSDSDTLRYPALAARVHWTWGKKLFDDGDGAEAQVHYGQASRTYERLGETENYGAMRSAEGWALYEQGDAPAAHRMARQAAGALRAHRRSVRLHALFRDWAEYAARDGMLAAAVAVQDEDVAVTQQIPRVLPEALQARAAFYLVLGDTARANADLDSASVLAPTLADPDRVTFLTRTRAVIGNRPARELDSAIAFFTRDKGHALWRMTALARRADLRLARGDWQRAGADLDSITAQIERTSAREPAYHLRSALIEQARARFDQLVMLHVRGNRPRKALQALERGRVAFRPVTDSRPAVDTRPRGPEGIVVLEYALIGDTLLAWTVRGDFVTLDHWPVDRDSLVFTIERADRALEHSGREAIAKPLLEQLHAWLIGPVSRRLPEGAKIVVVADGEIGRVPFSVLRDRQTGKDLVEKHTLSLASRLADAGPSQLVAASSSLRALLVADPAFEAAEHPTLDPLDGALAEMGVLRSLYPGADTLAGGNVSTAALRERAPRADVIHYAGHAIFDDAQPEQSFLVLAGRERLTADTISRWELGGVRLVVLSACSTIRARHGRSGGFAGLSGAFLSAGAGGVIGSLWPVNDSLAQPLMEAFHREYQKSRDPADALREAQLEMRRKRVSPTVWAGFRYVGG